VTLANDWQLISTIPPFAPASITRDNRPPVVRYLWNPILIFHATKSKANGVLKFYVIPREVKQAGQFFDRRPADTFVK